MLFKCLNHIWPLGGSTTNCKDNIDMLSWYKLVIEKVIATHAADIKQH